MKRRITLLLVALVLGGAALSPLACTSTIPRRDPSGERFPPALGESLEETPVRLPDDLAGAPALLIVGYVQDAQFDADRWLLGLVQAEAPVRVLEVPAVRGWVPRLIAGRIDSGMRAGIPEEDWGSVVTVYSDAGAIAELTGTEKPRNVRVVLLDSDGVVRWFHDRGYSAGKLLEMIEALGAL